MSWVIALLSLVYPAQLPPRDQDPRAVQIPQGTAAIRGRVVDAETGDPVSRIPVRLSGRGQQPGHVVLSDHEGRFEFTNLGAGKYFLMAESSPSRAGYLDVSFRDPRAADGRSGPPDPLELHDGQVRDDVRLAVPRARVITGRVLDEAGEPRARARVAAEFLDRDRRGVTQSVTTDDLGAFRLFGLPAGRYRLCALPDEHSAPDVHASAEGLVKTCYPSTVIETESTPVLVLTGNADVEIRLQRGRLFTISGVVVDASGAPAEHASVSLMTIEKDGGSGYGREAKEATFVFGGLAPGNYAVRAQIGDPFNANDTRDRQIGYVRIRIDAANVDNLVVPLKQPATVAGRIIFEGGVRPPIGALHVRAHADEDSERMQDWGRGPGSPLRGDLTFELKGLFGRYTLEVDPLPHGWVVKSVRYRGEDITEVPTDFASGTDASDLVMIVSNRPARMLARVLDERGNPTPSAVVVLVPADKRAWANRQTRMRMIFARDDVYQGLNLRPGEYYVAAVSPDDMPLSDDREWLETIATVAQKITLFENDHRTVDLQLVKLPAR